MKNLFPVILIYLSVIAISCNNDDDSPGPPNPGYNYFPLELGTFREYRIYTKNYFLRPDSVAGELVADSTEKTVYVRVVSESKILDIEGDSATRFGFYSKQKIDDQWSDQADSIAVVKRDQEELIYSINNRTFVKVIFPIKRGLLWNGNKYNALGEETYTISETNLSYRMDSLELQSVIRVLQSDVSNLVELDQRSEEYAPDVGLARKNTRILQYRQINGEVLTGEIAKGTVFLQELTGYGSI